MGADATKPIMLSNDAVLQNLLDEENGLEMDDDWLYKTMFAIMSETKRTTWFDMPEGAPDHPRLHGKRKNIPEMDPKKKPLIDWFNLIYWIPHKMFEHKSIQGNAAQDAVLSRLLSLYLQKQRSKSGDLNPEEIDQLKRAFLGGSFNEEKFNKVLKELYPTTSSSGQYSNSNSNSNSKPRNSKPDQKPGQKQDNKADDGVNIAEWTLPTARKHYDKCLIANKGQTPQDWGIACKRIAARFEELQNEQWDFEFWALVLGGGLCGLLFLFAFWWWWSGRMSSRGGGRGGRRGGRKQRGRYLP